MQKIFNIYINSTEKISGTNNDANYFIDWPAVLPDGRYKCQFFYMQDYSNIILNVEDVAENQPGVLCLNLGCTTNYFCNGSTLSNSNIIGLLKWEMFGPDGVGKGVLSANSTDNNSFYLQHRPTNNVLNLQIRLLDGTTLWTDSEAEPPYDYSICFTFELLD